MAERAEWQSRGSSQWKADILRPAGGVVNGRGSRLAFAVLTLPANFSLVAFVTLPLAIVRIYSFAVGFPMAMGIAFAPARWKNPLLLVILPFWTNLLIRISADPGQRASQPRVARDLVSRESRPNRRQAHTEGRKGQG